MKVKIKLGENEKRFIDRVSELSGENIYSCYQCGRCSAGCPFAFEMDILPNQIARLVQMGLEDELIHSKALFLCATCFTCQSRCPKGINIARVLIDKKGTAVHPEMAIKIGSTSDILFIRDDGYALGAPQSLMHEAYHMWSKEWTAFYDFNIKKLMPIIAYRNKFLH